MVIQRTDNRAGGASTSVTLHDVATALGISKATVSLVINNDSRVAEKTRARVLRKIDELGYVYNRGAAGLSTGRSNTVGLAVHDLSNPYFTEMCSAIESLLSENCRMSYLCNTRESLLLQKQFIEALVEHRADGLILCPADGTEIDDLKTIFTRKLATVLIARDIEGSSLDFIGNDEHLALKLVTEHLIRLGHRRIAMIGGGQKTSTSRRRRSGFYTALRESDIALDASLVLDCPATPKGGEEAIVKVMQLAAPPTAAVCFADLVALGVLSGLHFMNCIPGEDMAVVSCNDIEEASRGYVQLTTARINKTEIGRRAAEMLLQRIADPQLPARKILLKPELIVRRTCGSRAD